jgi:hypothetical protein
MACFLLGCVMHRWRFVESPACDCGAEEQTMRHIVDDCPLHWVVCDEQRATREWSTYLVWT